MDIFFGLLVSAIFGTFCSRRAKEFKLDHRFWFFLGFFFGLMALIALYIITRKLKKNPPEPVVTAPPPEPETPLTPFLLDSKKFWYYLDPSNQQFGPMSADALGDAWKKGDVTLDTYVWNEDFENWTPLKHLNPPSSSS
jgi:hypothetical protein